MEKGWTSPSSNCDFDYNQIAYESDEEQQKDS